MLIRAVQGRKIADEISIELTAASLTVTTRTWEEENGERVNSSSRVALWRLDDLRQRNDWQDRTIYSLGLDGTVYPVRAATAFSHESEGQHMSHARPDHWLRLLLPDTECTFEDCVITVRQPEEVQVSANVDLVSAPADNPDEPGRAILPKLKLSGPDNVPAGETIVMTVRLLMDDGSVYAGLTDVYLETINGYLPKPRVRVGGETVTFKVMPLGLDAGDTVRVKAGFRYFSGAREHVVRLA